MIVYFYIFDVPIIHKYISLILIHNYIQYFSKGNYVISKQGYSIISVIGFPLATISIDHLNKPVENVKIDISQDSPLILDLYQRVGLLKVHDGGVLLILSNDD